MPTPRCHCSLATLAPAIRALALVVVVAGHAAAQTAPEIVGPVRDIVREEIVYPALFDPRLELPLTPNPQAVIDARGGDVTGAARLGGRIADSSYSVFVSGPLHGFSEPTLRDRRNIPHFTVGFDLVNVMWRPKATPEFTRQLGTAGFLTSESGRPLDPPVSGTAPTGLSRGSEQAVARAVDTTDAVTLPWAFVFSSGYKFASTTYAYTDPAKGTSVSSARLADVAQAVFGVLFLTRPGDPGYFVAFSYNYSSLFFQGDSKIGGPTRVFGNLLRIEMRRPLVTAHMGFNPALTYETDTRLKTVEASTYWWFTPCRCSHIRNATKMNAGVRVGYEEGRGGVFASVFVGPTFGAIQ